MLLLTAILIALLVDRFFFHSSSSPAGTGSGVAATQARSLPPFTGVDLRELIARDATADLSGDGTIMLTATHSLNARVSGSGTVLYRGNPPHVTLRVTGSGTISAG